MSCCWFFLFFAQETENILRFAVQLIRQSGWWINLPSGKLKCVQISRSALMFKKILARYRKFWIAECKSRTESGRILRVDECWANRMYFVLTYTHDPVNDISISKPFFFFFFSPADAIIRIKLVKKNLLRVAAIQDRIVFLLRAVPKH